MVHLSRLAEDLILWASAEFRLLRLPDGFATGSSIMPQKRNPDVAELARGKSARVIGNLVQSLTLLKGLPLSYNRDLQEDKEPLFDTVDTLLASLTVVAAMLPELRFDAERGRAAAVADYALATDLADHLAKRGVPFREAHRAVGELVAMLEREERELASLTLEELRAAHPPSARRRSRSTSMRRSRRATCRAARRPPPWRVPSTPPPRASARRSGPRARA